MRALGETGAEESGVEDNQDPRPALEEDGRQENAHPEGDFEGRHNRHGHVVVGLNELADSVGNGVAGRLGAGRSTSRGLDGLNGRDDVLAEVGRDVENRVDSVREHGEGVLGAEQPDQGHEQVLNVLIREQTDGTASGVLGANLLASAPGLVDYNAVGYRRGHKGGAVGELGHAAIVVHSDVRQRVSEDA